MTDLEIWVVGWTVAGVVVLLAAALLIWILVVGWSLERETARALAALKRIEVNTRPIWRLSSTADAVERIRADSDELERALRDLAAGLNATEEAGS